MTCMWSIDSRVHAYDEDIFIDIIMLFHLICVVYSNALGMLIMNLHTVNTVSIDHLSFGVCVEGKGLFSA